MLGTFINQAGLNLTNWGIVFSTESSSTYLIFVEVLYIAQQPEDIISLDINPPVSQMSPCYSS